MPITPAPYVRRPYSGDGLVRLADLGMQTARAQANRERDRGERSAQRLSTIGQTVASGLGAIRQEREQAPIRAAQARRAQYEETQIVRGEEAYQAGQAKTRSDAQKSQRLKDLLQANNGQRLPSEVLLREFGPEDAAQIDKHFDELFPKPKEAEPFTLNPGDVRFDGSGKQIAGVPKPEPVAGPISVGGRLVDPKTFKTLYEPPSEPTRPVAVADGGRLVDPSTGRVVYQAPPKAGEPKAAPKLAAGTADKVAMAKTSLAALDKLESLVNEPQKDGTVRFRDELMGPWAGRYNKAESTDALGIASLLPDAPQGFSDFSAESATLKNQVIQAITGAAVGVQEAGRILDQVPTENDKGTVWVAKAKATRRNLEELIFNQVQMGTGAQAPLENGMTVEVNVPGTLVNPFRRKK